MKSNLTFVVATTCSALLISSAFAGDHHHGLGRASLSSAAGTTATTATLLGRSPLGEPVFLYTAPINQVSERARPFHANVASPLRKPIDHLGTTGGEKGVEHETHPRIESSTVSSGSGASAGSERHRHVVFTPPPTIQTLQTPTVPSAANPASANRSIDNPFSGSILNTGLTQQPSKQTPATLVATTPQNDVVSNASFGSGSQGRPTTVFRPGSPIVQLLTSSSATAGR